MKDHMDIAHVALVWFCIPIGQGPRTFRPAQQEGPFALLPGRRGTFHLSVDV